MTSIKTLKEKSARRLFALLLTLLMLFTAVPIAPVLADAPITSAKHALSPAALQAASKQPIKPPRKLTAAELTKPQMRKLVFSASPSDLEIFNARIFFDPLLPIKSSASIEENKELANALIEFKSRTNKEDVAALVRFVKSHPDSRWTPSLESAIAQQRFETGYLSDALTNWTAAWQSTKSARDGSAKTVADGAISNLVILEARLGLTQNLEKHLAEIGKRRLTGSVEQRVNGAKLGLAEQKHNPGISFKCGPYAVNSIANRLSPAHPLGCSTVLKNAASSTRGTNLAQLLDWSKQVGLKMRMAKRSQGTTILVPSVVHWQFGNSGHFAAIVDEKDGKYQIEDPTFGESHNAWVSSAAVNSQTDGYFLVMDRELPSGWADVSRSDGERVWGKGIAYGRDGQLTPWCPKCPWCPTSGGMASATAFAMNASLNISDHPLQYFPPAGPAMDFLANYNDGEGAQPSAFSFTNIGFDWSLNWVSYLTVDGSSNVTVRVRGGGYEVYDYPYAPNVESQAQMVNVGGGSYQRQLPDGSVENFTLSDGTNTYMTSVVDPQGNAASISYDGNLRVTSITDACGNTTTLTYVSNTPGASGFYNITQITDAFSRSCSFSYDSTNTFLTAITDACGNVSSFVYDQSSNFITMMTTPYGSTSFYAYSPSYGYGAAVGLRVNYPDGTTSVIENWISEQKETYYWDREATALYPVDPANLNYTHCQSWRWLYDQSSTDEAPVYNWIRPALENPTVYTYPGETDQDFLGTSNKPTQIARQLSYAGETFTVSGTVTPGDYLTISVYDPYLTYYTEATNCSYRVQTGDTLASIAAGLAAAVNATGIIQAYGMSATVSSNVVTIKSPSILQTTYVTTSGGGTETITAAPATNQTEVASITGSATAGDTVTVTVHDSGLSGGQESVSYAVQAGDSLTSISQSLSLALNADTNLQGIGVSSMWNSPGSGNGALYVQSNSPNTTTYTSSTSGGATETVTLSTSTTGLVQATNYQRNTLGYPTQRVDAIGRTFDYTYASNNIDLLQAQEVQPSGSTSLMGQWAYTDSAAPHRPTSYIDGSGQQTQYSYNTPFAELATITDALGETTTLSYNANGYLTQVQGPLAGSQDVTTFTFFGYGLPQTVTDSEGYEVTYAWDNLNRLTSTTYPDGTSEQNVYSKLDNVLSADRLGRWSRSSFDSMDQLACQQDPLGRATRYCWCTCGSLKSLTDANGNVTTWNHDLEGRVVQKVYADSSTVNYVFQPETALLQSQTDALNQTKNYLYNIDDTQQYKSYANAVNATSPVATAYDTNFARMTSVSNGWGKYSYNYNPYVSTLTNKAFVFIGGFPNTPSATDTISITFSNSALSGGHYTMPAFSVPSGDAGNAAQTATDLATAISSNSTLSAAGISASANGTLVTVSAASAVTVAPSATGSTTATVGGGGMLAQVTNSTIANSPITYSYDALERTANRMINGGNNNVGWSYDAMSRITEESNPLGNFNYAYVDDTSGSSKGTLRLSSISYPNGQSTNFSWYGNIGDQRLQSINNYLPNGSPLSQFSYGYDSAGEITRWGQEQSPSYSPRIQALDYDAASQLTASKSGFGAAPPKYADQLFYSYDKAANRTAVQSSTEQTATIKGTVTSSNVLTIVVHDPALTGGTESVNYTVQSSDTLASIATNLAAAITADTNLQSLGVNATASSNQITIKSTSANLSTYSESTSGGATETISLGLSTNAVQNATIGGAVSSGNLLTLTAFDTGLTGGSASVNYTATSGDSLNSIATHLASAVNGSSALSAAGITATATQNVVHIKSTSANLTTYSQSVTSGGTETIYLSLNNNGPETFLVGGTITSGNVLGIKVTDQNLTGGSESVTHTVISTDTATTIAAALASAINSDTNLQNIGVSAGSSGAVITITSLSTAVTTYRGSRPNTATETLVQGINPNGAETAAIGGSKTTSDTLTITIYDAGLTGGSKAKSYTVLSGDSLSTIATGLANAIASDSTLSALGITASAASTVVNLKSTSNNLTTYASSVSTGATETIKLGNSLGVTGASFNNLNELTATSAGGNAHFQGDTNKPIVSAAINSIAAALPTSTTFNANASLSTGSNSVNANAVDGGSNSVSNAYQLSVPSGSSTSLTFDANGNMTSDGTNSFSYDAENRLIKITYPGSGNYTAFTYDGFGRNVEIQEYSSSTLTITKQLVWASDKFRPDQPCEARNSSGTITAQYFPLGETMSGTDYFYTTDHLGLTDARVTASKFSQLGLIGGHPGGFDPVAHAGSTREMTNSSGTVEAQLGYDPFGRTTQLQGSMSPDFQFAGYYEHGPSGLNETLFRAYSSALGRFINRDPIGIRGGVNLFDYVGNQVVGQSDADGLCCGVPSVSKKEDDGGDGGDDGDGGYIDPVELCRLCCMANEIKCIIKEMRNGKSECDAKASCKAWRNFCEFLCGIGIECTHDPLPGPPPVPPPVPGGSGVGGGAGGGGPNNNNPHQGPNVPQAPPPATGGQQSGGGIGGGGGGSW